MSRIKLMILSTVVAVAMFVVVLGVAAHYVIVVRFLKPLARRLRREA